MRPAAVVGLSICNKNKGLRESTKTAIPQRNRGRAAKANVTLKKNAAEPHALDPSGRYGGLDLMLYTSTL
jgi:hypothetical protein